MKKEIKLSFFLLLAILVFFACKKNGESILEPIPLPDQGYAVDEAAEIMTLAAIAYIAEGEVDSVIKNSIIFQLKNTALATGGNWKLAWGPGISGNKSNLVYIVVDSTSSPMSYAMVVRGTNVKSIDDIIQDFQTFHFVPFTYGLPGDSIARGSMRGLDSLLIVKDPVTGKTVEGFLNSLPDNGNKKMFITGHSQGGALAPLLAYWFITSSGVVDRYDVEIYAFAGPSVSNQIFKTNFTNSIPATGYFHMVANSLDIVPYFWARHDSLVINNIPAPVPWEYRLLIDLMDDFLDNNHIKYAQLADQIYIGSFPPKDTLGNIHPHDTLQWYNYWGLTQHRHNNYLKLLNAQPVN